MTVAELIELLKTFPQDLPVAYCMFSEYCLMESGDIRVEDHCAPRPDGWIHAYRDDKPRQLYLVFPGN